MMSVRYVSARGGRIVCKAMHARITRATDDTVCETVRLRLVRHRLFDLMRETIAFDTV